MQSCLPSAADIPAMRLKFSTLLSGLALLLFVSLAHADLLFTLTPTMRSGVGSNEVFFTGVLTNSSPTNLFLNNLQINFTDAAANYLSADTNVFFANVPGILLPGEIYSDIVFAIGISSAATNGDYVGTITIQ